jgi:hypothetical protein
MASLSDEKFSILADTITDLLQKYKHDTGILVSCNIKEIPIWYDRTKKEIPDIKYNNRCINPVIINKQQLFRIQKHNDIIELHNHIFDTVKYNMLYNNGGNNMIKFGDILLFIKSNPLYDLSEDTGEIFYYSLEGNKVNIIYLEPIELTEFEKSTGIKFVH